jgi:hypothetical protein
MPNQIDGAYQIFYSIPGPIYIGTQSAIEALVGVQEGAFAVGYTVTPADGVFGFFDGSVWVWGSGGGGGGVESVTGDGVDNTDPANPVISYPTPGDIGAEPALGYIPENVANKKTTMTGNESSNTFYLTAKAIYDWATGLFLQKNAPITGATNTKITYDANGLVTSGTSLSASDIPSGIDATKIGSGSVDNTEFGYLNGVTSAIQTQLDGKQASLGYTPENVANKKTTMTGNEASDTFYLSAKAIYDWATGLFSNSNGWTPYSAVMPTRLPSPLDGTFTVTIASPAVVTKNSHGLLTGQKIRLTTTGALPTGLATGTDYYVIVINANTFNLATSMANALQTTSTKINTSGTQSGVHSLVVQTDPNYYLQFAGVDLTSTLYEGMPIYLTQNSIVRYAWICSTPVYSGGNTTFWVLTRCDGTSANYDILDTGTYPISGFNYGLPRQPGSGFPILQSYWTITVTDANNNAQASPGTSTCTPGGIGIQKPIGAFIVKFIATAWIDIATTQCSMTMGLTEDKTTLTEPSLTAYQVTYAVSVAAFEAAVSTPINGDTKIYVLAGVTGTAGATNFRLRGDLGSGGYTRQIVLSAACAYLS